MSTPTPTIPEITIERAWETRPQVSGAAARSVDACERRAEAAEAHLRAAAANLSAALAVSEPTAADIAAAYEALAEYEAARPRGDLWPGLPPRYRVSLAHYGRWAIGGGYSRDPAHAVEAAAKTLHAALSGAGVAVGELQQSAEYWRDLAAAGC